MSNKEITTIIKLQIQAGKAAPSPPIGPALGQHGVNIMDFCKSYNDQTKNMDGVIPVEISVYKDKSFTHARITKTSSEYDAISVFYKSKDQKYIIEAVIGEIKFNNFKDCSKKQKKIIKNVSSSVSTKGKKNNKVHGIDKTGKSKVIQTSFKLNGGNLNAACFKYEGDLKAKYGAPLNVSLTSTDLLFWIRNKAYR